MFSGGDETLLTSDVRELLEIEHTEELKEMISMKRQNIMMHAFLTFIF